MKAVIESIGKVGSRVRLGSHELVFDQPSAVPGGEDRGPSPFDVMVASVAACAHYYASAYLHARELPTDGLRIAVESEKEKTPVPRIGRLTMTVHLPEGLPDKHRAGVERAIKICPAYGTLLHSPKVEVSVEHASAPEPAHERRTA